MAALELNSVMNALSGLVVIILAFIGMSKTRSSTLSKIFIVMVLVGLILLGYGIWNIFN